MTRSMMETLVGLADRTTQRERVLAHLVGHGFVDEASLAQAQAVGHRTNQPIESVLNQMGAVSDDAITAAYVEVSGCPKWSPADLPAEHLPDLHASIEYLRDSRLLPLALTDQILTVAACDPLDNEALAGLAFAAGLNLEILVANPADWRRAFLDLYSSTLEDKEVDERKVESALQIVSDSGADSQSARFVTSVVETAVNIGASDIHFEPRRHDLRVRLRVDGRLVDFQTASGALAAPVVSRIKVLASLDLGERRLPHDGRATFIVGGRAIDVRISVLPSAFGETAVLRILDRTAVGFDFEALGFAGRERDLLSQIAHAPHGIFVITGPTGSGKTTTLYSLLSSLSSSEKKILSVEDPIEYHFDHVVQVQAHPSIGLTFAHTLRSFLRQDPDIILVGEIRDSETAEVAIQAAMTGHLVLASIHANDAIKVAPRLLDMGLEPYQLAATLRGSLAQRLVRKLCTACRQRRAPTAAEQAFVASVGCDPVDQIFDATGCGSCGGSGFRGRVVIAEGLHFDDEMAEAIANPSTRSLSTVAALRGYRPLIIDGVEKAATGLTTLREVMASAGAP